MEPVFAGVKHVAVNEEVVEFVIFEDLSALVASIKNKSSAGCCTFKALQTVADCSYVFLSLPSGRLIKRSQVSLVVAGLP